MMFRSLFDRDLFADLDRLQREMQQALDPSPSIRGLGRGGFPALNVGSTPNSVEIYAFAPGVDPASIDLNLDRGVLTLSGERRSLANGTEPPGVAKTGDDRPGDARTTVHMEERFTGRFQRVVSLPDDIDPSAVEARYRDGVLHVSVQRRTAAQPRRIQVQ